MLSCALFVIKRRAFILHTTYKNNNIITLWEKGSHHNNDLLNAWIINGQIKIISMHVTCTDEFSWKTLPRERCSPIIIVRIRSTIARKIADRGSDNPPLCAQLFRTKRRTMRKKEEKCFAKGNRAS